MPLLSVLTAAIGEWAAYVAEAGESLAAQNLPAGWELEWVVQEDGPDPVLAEVVGRFPFARHEASGRRLGTSATRNLALVRSRGSLLHLLDCDDLLLPNGLAVPIAAFDAHQDIHWAVGQALNLMPDATRVAFEPVSPTGYVKAGVVGDYVLADGESFLPFLPNTLTYRSATVRAMGGWSATANGEDTMLLVAVTELAPGYHSPEVTWLWRQHDRQTSRNAEWEAQLRPGVELIRQRVRALRELGVRISAS
jgi:glycosyltransferase involved in cell wall biosynthesis